MKPFRTVDEMADILRGRGMIVPDEDKILLNYHNYYCVINSYKDLFLDKTSNTEQYLEGTTIRDVVRVYEFDRNLRAFLFPWLMEIEQLLKAVISHRASEHYKDNPEFYLRTTTYSQKRTDAKHSTKTISKLKWQGKKDHPSLNHYRKRYGHIPFWVLVNNIYFGELSYFYKLLNSRAIKDAIVKDLKKLNSSPVRELTVERLSTYMRVLADFRNVCAHNERCYCYKHKEVSVRGSDHANIADILEIIETFLDSDSLKRFANDFVELKTNFIVHSGVRVDIIDIVISSMGLPDELSAG